MSVVRHDIQPEQAVEFSFASEYGYDFLVKNFTDDRIYVSFGTLPPSKNEMVCIPARSWQRHICQAGYIESVWIIGTVACKDGAEVECLRTRQIQPAVANERLPIPIMRKEIADYLRVDGVYQLMGVGFSALDENPGAKLNKKTYVSHDSATTVVSSYDTEFPYAADMIASQDVIMALWKVARDHLTGADAMFEYVRVDLFDPVADQANVYQARHFIVTDEVSSNAAEGGNPMTLSGTLHVVGNMIPGTFDTVHKIFYPY